MHRPNLIPCWNCAGRGRVRILGLTTRECWVCFGAGLLPEATFRAFAPEESYLNPYYDEEYDPAGHRHHEYDEADALPEQRRSFGANPPIPAARRPNLRSPGASLSRARRLNPNRVVTAPRRVIHRVRAPFLRLQRTFSRWSNPAQRIKSAGRRAIR